MILLTTSFEYGIIKLIYGGVFMIFYFSATGNSRYTAQKLAALTGDKAYNIANLINSELPGAGRNDVTGFVFPVYYSGLPEIVSRFAERLDVRKNLSPYIYSVITCDASADAADKKLAAKLGVNIDYSFSLVMPDNYVVFYNPCETDRAIEKLTHAGEMIETIASQINEGRILVRDGILNDVKTAFMYPLYNIFRRTGKFYVTDKCVGCGRCEANCPDGAIEIRKDKPVWVKAKCQHCTACINNCPADAIQYGKKTETRGRYSIEKLMKK